MFQSLRERFLGWLRGVTCDRLPKLLETSEDVTEVFLDLFRGHGLPCSLRDGWIIAGSGCLKAQARIFIHRAKPKFCSIQLDLEVQTESGETIFESCGGWGKTLHEAIADAIKIFCDGSFHVIFSAVTGLRCSHCDIEEWLIGGSNRRVFISPVVIRTVPSGEQPEIVGWFGEMAEHIKKCPLNSGRHWIRLYHADGVALERIDEALLDNEVSPEFEQHLARFAWPSSTHQLYSVRVFLIIEPLV